MEIDPTSALRITTDLLKDDLRRQTEAEVNKGIEALDRSNLSPRQKNHRRWELDEKIVEVEALLRQNELHNQSIAESIISLGLVIPSGLRLRAFLENPTEAIHPKPVIPTEPNNIDELDAYKEIIKQAEERFNGFGSISPEDQGERVWRMRELTVLAGFEMNRGIRWVTPITGRNPKTPEFEVVNFNFTPDVPEGIMLRVYDSLGNHLRFLDHEGDSVIALSDLIGIKVEDFKMPLIYRNTLRRKGLVDAFGVVSTSVNDLVRTSTQFSIDRGNGLPYLIAALVKKGIYPKV